MKFKKEKDKMLFTLLHPALIMIYADLCWYAKERHNIDLVVTSTVSTPAEDMELQRTSTAHQSRIALDIRTKNIDSFVTSDLIHYINSKDAYAKFRYLSYSGERRLAYWHLGSEEHIHLALDKSFSLKKAIPYTAFH